MKLFPNLEFIVILGEDSYQQFQKFVMRRDAPSIKSFGELLKPQGWAEESVGLPYHKERAVRVFYCYHPTYGYNRSPSIAHLLG